MGEPRITRVRPADEPDDVTLMCPHCRDGFTAEDVSDGFVAEVVCSMCAKADLTADPARAVARELRTWVLRIRPLEPLTADMASNDGGACRWRDARRLEMRAEQLDPGGAWPNLHGGGA